MNNKRKLMGIFSQRKYSIVVKSIAVLLVHAFVLISVAPSYALDKITPAGKANLSPSINISNNEMLEAFKILKIEQMEKALVSDALVTEAFVPTSEKEKIILEAQKTDAAAVNPNYQLLDIIPHMSTDLKPEGKKAGGPVILRGVVNVKSNAQGTIDDATRLDNMDDTLRYLLNNNFTPILVGHNGSVKFDKETGKWKDNREELDHVYNYLIKHLLRGIIVYHKGYRTGTFDASGREIIDITRNEKGKTIEIVQGRINLLNNVRLDNEQADKKAKRMEFADRLMSLAGERKIYVADDFADIGSKGASVEQAPLLANEVYVGPAMVREFKEVRAILKGIQAIVFGSGEKLDDKLPLLKGLLQVVRKYAFMGSGPSKALENNQELLEELKKIAGDMLVLAKDYSDITKFDIGNQTVVEFLAKLDTLKAGDVVLANGTMGFMEYKEEGKLTDKYTVGSEKVFIKLKKLAQRGVKIVIVGGDGGSTAKRYGLDKEENVVTFTGGGVPLKIIVNQLLSGIKALGTAQKKINIKRKMNLTSEEEAKFNAYTGLIDALDDAFPQNLLLHTSSTKCVDTLIDGRPGNRKSILNLTIQKKAVVYEIPKGQRQPKKVTDIDFGENYNYATVPMFIPADNIPKELKAMIEEKKPQGGAAISAVVIDYLYKHFKNYPVHVTTDKKTRSQTIDPKVAGDVTFNVETTIANLTSDGDLEIQAHFWFRHNDAALEALNEYIDVNMKQAPEYKGEAEWASKVNTTDSEGALQSLALYGATIFDEFSRGDMTDAETVAAMINAVDIADMLNAEGILYDQKSGWFASKKDIEAAMPGYGENLGNFNAELNSIEEFANLLYILAVPNFTKGAERGQKAASMVVQNAVIKLFYRMQVHFDDLAESQFADIRIFEPMRALLSDYAARLNNALRADDAIDVNAKGTDAEAVIAHLTAKTVNLSDLEQGLLRGIYEKYKNDVQGLAYDVAQFSEIFSESTFTKAFRHIKVGKARMILPSEKPLLAIDGGAGRISTLGIALRMQSDINAREPGFVGEYSVRTRSLKGKGGDKLDRAKALFTKMMSDKVIRVSGMELVTQDGSMVTVSELIADGRLTFERTNKVETARQDFNTDIEIECVYPVNVKLDGKLVAIVNIVEAQDFIEKMKNELSKRGIHQDNIPRPIIIAGKYYGLMIDATPGGVEIGNLEIQKAWEKGEMSLKGPTAYSFVGVNGLKNKNFDMNAPQELERLLEIFEQIENERGVTDEMFIYLKAQITAKLLLPRGGGMHYAGRFTHKVPMVKEKGAMFFTPTSCSTNGGTYFVRALSIITGFGRSLQKIVDKSAEKEGTVGAVSRVVKKVITVIGTTLHKYTGGDKKKGPYGHTGAQGTGAAKGVEQHRQVNAHYTALRTGTALRDGEVIIDGGSIFDKLSNLPIDIKEEVLLRYFERYSNEFTEDIAMYSEKDKKDGKYLSEDTIEGQRTGSILFKDFFKRVWKKLYRMAVGYDNELGYSYKMEEGLTSLFNSVKRQKDKVRRYKVKKAVIKKYEESLQKKIEAAEVSYYLERAI
ncbi:MAG: phosphoglycerate kinase [Candidatus Omnitrophica bacterium]|nr:phosphoglycerate kinase [Candidatus Omnitrophota bacterium]